MLTSLYIGTVAIYKSIIRLHTLLHIVVYVTINIYNNYNIYTYKSLNYS